MNLESNLNENYNDLFDKGGKRYRNVFLEAPGDEAHSLLGSNDVPQSVAGDYCELDRPVELIFLRNRINRKAGIGTRSKRQRGNP